MKLDMLTLEEIVAGDKSTFYLGYNTYHKNLSEAILCADGTSLSVQASKSHYCTPEDDYGPYSHVEVGFPSATPPDSWIEYCENTDDLTNTVYAWIPVELVREFIELHGGEV